MGWLKNVLVAHDQLINALAGGWPDETLSSRAWRWHRDGARSWPRRLVDRLFWWDRDAATGRRHCELSYLSEALRLQMPPELRDGNDNDNNGKERRQ